MKPKYRLTAAANTLAPAYFLLQEKGYNITQEGKHVRAENEMRIFVAEDILALAGLVFLFEHKGKSWQFSDEQIDEFIAWSES